MSRIMKSNECSIIMIIGLKLSLVVEKLTFTWKWLVWRGIECYNKTICKGHTSLDDGCEDYISEDDIGGIEVTVF